MLVPRRLQMLGDQCRILVGRRWIVCLDDGGQPSMQFRAIRFELRFVGNGSNQGVTERIFVAPPELHLVDQFRCDEWRDVHRLDDIFQQSRIES